MRALFFILTTICLLIAVGSAGLLIPHLKSGHDMPAIVFADNIGKTLAHYWESMLSNPAESLPEGDSFSISSTFTPLQGRSVGIPYPERSGNGGGLTSWGDMLILITHEGKIYIVDKNREVTTSNIQAPPNGFDDYKIAAQQPPFENVEHQFHRFRYNDISFFEFEDTRGLLVSYTKYHDSRRCYTTTVSRLLIGNLSTEIADIEADGDDWTDIFETQPCLPLKTRWRSIEGHMAGGRMVFDGRHTIYLASGDYGWDGMFGPYNIAGAAGMDQVAVAQDPKTDYGKVIAIDIRNGSATQRSSGHRNPQGIALDRNGHVWVVEHGARGGDELNHIVKGTNYGWPLESLGTSYAVLPLPTAKSFGHHDQFARPMYAWLPSIAVSGLMCIEDFHPAWDGDLLASSLRAKQLARIRIAEDRVIFSERIDIGHRIRYVHQHTGGQIVLWTDGNLLIFLAPSPGGLGMKYINYRLNITIDDPILRQKTRIAINDCLECHALNGVDTNSPIALSKIFTPKKQGNSHHGFTEEKVIYRKNWTKTQLTEFLRDPATIIYDTKMPDPNIEDDEVLREVVSIIEGLSKDIKIPFRHRD